MHLKSQHYTAEVCAEVCVEVCADVCVGGLCTRCWREVCARGVRVQEVCAGGVCEMIVQTCVRDDCVQEVCAGGGCGRIDCVRLLADTRQ